MFAHVMLNVPFIRRKSANQEKNNTYAHIRKANAHPNFDRERGCEAKHFGFLKIEQYCSVKQISIKKKKKLKETNFFLGLIHHYADSKIHEG